MPENRLLDTSSYPTAATGNKLLPQPDMMATAGQGLGMLQQLQGLETSKFDLLAKQNGALQGIFASVAADPSAENVATRAAQARQMGIPESAVGAAVDEFSKVGGNPEGIRNIAIRHLGQLANVDQLLTMAGRNRPDLVNTGKTLVPITSSSGKAPGISVAGGGAVPLTTSPEAGARPVAGPPGPNNEPTTITQDDFSRRTSGGTAMVTAPAPGVAEASREAGGASGSQLAGERREAASFRDTAFPLEQAIPALERLGTTGTGPGTEGFNKFKSALLSLGVPGVDVDKIKNFDEAQKYLTDFVNKNGNTGTNDKLAAAFAGNPSVGISNAAAVDVAKSALALKRFQAARVAKFDTSGKPEVEYSRWAADFAKNQDVRAYGFDMMSREAQQKLLRSMTPGSPEMNRFIQSLRDAHVAELINRNR